MYVETGLTCGDRSWGALRISSSRPSKTSNCMADKPVQVERDLHKNKTRTDICRHIDTIPLYMTFVHVRSHHVMSCHVMSCHLTGCKLRVREPCLWVSVGGDVVRRPVTRPGSSGGLLPVPYAPLLAPMPLMNLSSLKRSKQTLRR